MNSANLNLIVLIYLLSCDLTVKAQQANESTHESQRNDVGPRLFEKLYLGQNDPNPFKVSQSTTISFRSDSADDAKIIVFNSRGEAVITFEKLIGKESVTIDGGRLSPGKYRYCLVVLGRAIARKKFQVIP